MGEKDHFNINLEDEVVRGAIVLKDGQLLWPAPPVSVSAQPQAQAVRYHDFISSC